MGTSLYCNLNIHSVYGIHIMDVFYVPGTLYPQYTEEDLPCMSRTHFAVKGTMCVCAYPLE